MLRRACPRQVPFDLLLQRDLADSDGAALAAVVNDPVVREMCGWLADEHTDGPLWA
jgi:hypothetical protein